MNKNVLQRGQSFIIVLIMMAIGALIVVPSLTLVDTALRNSNSVEESNRGLYACEAAQELIMWKLYHGTLAYDLYESSDNTSTFTVDVCGTEVSATVILRATEAVEGIILATDNTKFPSMRISDDGINFSENITVPYAVFSSVRNYWFEFNVEQISSNTTDSMEALWHIIPADFKNITYLDSEINIDGEGWQDLATYNSDYVPDDISTRIYQFPGTGTFGDDFGKMVPGQVNSIRYKISAQIQNSGIELCNWSIIRVGDLYTVSSPQAFIIVLDSKDEFSPGCDKAGFFSTYKESDPVVIPPLESSNVTYTVHISNIKDNTQKIARVIDFLPPGFTFVTMVDGFYMTDPTTESETVNGITRQKLTWLPDYSINAGETVDMVFRCVALQGISGSYFNEVLVLPNTIPTMSNLTDIDPDYNWELALGQNYSWNSGTVIVPAYDTETTAEGENITANMGLSETGVDIFSWHVE